MGYFDGANSGFEPGTSVYESIALPTELNWHVVRRTGRLRVFSFHLRPFSELGGWRVTGIGPVSRAWEARIIYTIRYPHFGFSIGSNRRTSFCET